MNTNNKDSVEKLEEIWGLHWSELNKNIITRSQSLKERETNSVLDYFFASNPIKYFHRIEQRGGSDHFPIETLFEISNNPKINKNYKITKPNRNPNKQQIPYSTLSSPPLCLVPLWIWKNLGLLENFQQNNFCKKLCLWTYCEQDFLIFVCFSYLNTMK